MVIDPKHVPGPNGGLDAMKEEVDKTAAYIKTSPPLPKNHSLRSAAGAPQMLPVEENEVLLPGEAEQY